MPKRHSRLLVPVILAGIVVVVVIAVWFYFFGKASTAAKLVPADNMMYIQMNPDAGDIIPSDDGSYLENLGAVFWSSFSLNNPWFSFEDDVKPWLGDQVVLTKASPDLLDPFVLIAEVGDKSEALRTVEGLQDKFSDGSTSLSKERYKGVDIYQLEDQVMMSGCYFKGYIVLSSQIESVKEIIRVGSGDESSLAGTKQFKKLSENLTADDQDLSLLVSLRLRQVLETTASALGIKTQLLVKRLDFPDEMLFCLAMWPQESGLQLKTYLGSARFEGMSGSEIHMQNTVPRDIIAYFEGENITSLLREFADDVQINEDALTWAKGSYAVSLIPQSGDRISALTLAIEVADEELAAAKIREAEPVLLGSLASIGITGDTEFKDGEINNISTRYANFDSGIRMNLNYALIDNKLIFATSPEAMSSMIEVNSGNVASLADNQDFDIALAKTQASRQTAFAFLQTEGLGEIFAPTAVGDLAENEEVPPGFIAQVLSPFSNLGISVYNTGKGDFLTDMYLNFKADAE